MTVPILTTKLYTPPVRPELVSRPRLIERMEEGLRLNHRLTLVSAPAGFGKTTVIVDWLNQKGRCFTWLSLDEGDNDPTRFMAYLVAALQKIDPTVGQNLAKSAKLPPTETLVTLLINDLAAIAEPFVLVLDDYHQIRAPHIHQALALLQERQPPTMHLVLTTRQDPPLPLPRWRVRGQVSEIRQEDLRFTSSEVADFLNRTMHLNLTTEAVSALERRTEGWIAGLQLAALSLRGYAAERVSDFIDAFSGSHRYVIDYLVEEVIQQQPADLRDFLHQTAILDRLTAPLCEAVTGRRDSKTILAQLEQANLFLIPLDERREWYRYHHLFSEFLRTELQTSELVTLHQKAAAWFEQQHLPGEAIRHALAAEDFALAAQLIKQVAEAALQNGRLTTLLNWLEALPEAVVTSSFDLALYKGWVCWLLGQGEAAATYGQAAGDARPADISGASQAKLTGLQACLVLGQGNFARSVELAEAALAHFDERTLFFRGMVLIILAEAQSALGLTVAAVQTLREASAVGQQSDDHFLIIGIMANLADQLHLQGKRREAMDLCRQMMKRFVDARGEPWPMTGLAYMQFGIMAYDGNDMTTARSYMERGLALSEQQGLMGSIIGGKIGLALVSAAEGDTLIALTLVIEARQITAQAGFEIYEPVFAALEADFQMKHGNLVAAEQWLAAANISPATPLTPIYEFVFLIYTRLLLNLNQPQPAQALELLARVETVVGQGGRDRMLLITLVQQALAYAALQQTEQALACLEKALALAAPEGYIFPFLDEGPAVAVLLPKLHHIAPAFVAELLQAFATQPNGKAREPKRDVSSATLSALIEPLSDRELELLQLVTGGRSNKEIAESLFITVGTVKKHLNNIFGKLNTKNRTEAVARARELGLVD